jgi:hypothetical protein
MERLHSGMRALHVDVHSEDDARGRHNLQRGEYITLIGTRGYVYGERLAIDGLEPRTRFMGIMKMVDALAG